MYDPPRTTRLVGGVVAPLDSMGRALSVERGLAMAMLDGAWEPGAMRRRAQQALGQKPRWLSPLIGRVLERFPEPPAEPEPLEDALCLDERFAAAIARAREPLRIRRWFTPEPAMVPVDGRPAGFAVPPLASEAELADFLGVAAADLAWLADKRQINRRAADPRLRHYTYRWVTKRSGGHRLIEAPKPRLKAIQRALLDRLLAFIPATEHAHGFVRGRSIHSFAAPHVGKAVVIRLDLRDFFAAITRSRITAIFRRVGYPRPVAASLAGLCTAATPEQVLSSCPRTGDPQQRFFAAGRLRDAHLPQGAPTSPHLANLAAVRLDRRLAGLARTADADYTRYADDLVFSGGGELSRGATRFVHLVGGIALDEGFEVGYRKTRVMRAGRRQLIGGLVVNRRANVKRGDYDALRALLHNAARTGFEIQNRDGHADFRAHLEGRIAWIAASNPKRGALLERLLRAIGPG